MPLHKFSAKDYEILSPAGGIAVRFPNGEDRLASSLIDTVAVHTDKLVVSITGDLGNYRALGIAFKVILFADLDEGYPETAFRKEAEMLFKGPISEEDFHKLITLGNTILQNAQESTDLYAVYMQATRKYAMDIIRF